MVIMPQYLTIIHNSETWYNVKDYDAIILSSICAYRLSVFNGHIKTGFTTKQVDKVLSSLKSFNVAYRIVKKDEIIDSFFPNGKNNYHVFLDDVSDYLSKNGFTLSSYTSYIKTLSKEMRGENISLTKGLDPLNDTINTPAPRTICKPQTAITVRVGSVVTFIESENPDFDDAQTYTVKIISTQRKESPTWTGNHGSGFSSRHGTNKEIISHNKNEIIDESPLAKAILGKRQGNTVSLKITKESPVLYIKILEIAE